jgi:flagellar hook-associated protein 3 FlgL
MASERMQKTQEQLSSGKRVSKPSDDAIGVPMALSLRADLSKIGQYKDNVNSCIDTISAASNKLTAVENVVLELIGFAQDGKSGLITAETRDALANQVDEYLKELIDLANARDGGKSIFGGTQTLSDPFLVTYSADGSITAVTQAYPNDINTSIQRSIGNGQTISVNAKGGEIFQPGYIDALNTGTGDVFKAAINLRDALLSGDFAVISASERTLSDSYDRIVNANAVLGARNNRLEGVLDRLEIEETNFKGRISDIEDADYVKTAMDYNSQSNVYQAALRVGAQLIGMSLVDYM